MNDHCVAMSGEISDALTNFLQREDGQENICFALYRRAEGSRRITGLIFEVLWPLSGDRNVHGNASFNPRYLQRALAVASAKGCGIALLHSHPLGVGWQDMSPDDIIAERSTAPAVFGATGLPLVGLTQAGDHTWSARFWIREAPRQFARSDCSRVRIAGDSFRINFNDALAPKPVHTEQQIRTVSAWGDECQSDMARLTVGIVGGGSVGGIVAEGLARMGVRRLVVIDPDVIEPHNLDRLTYATGGDIGQLKVDVLGSYLESATTSDDFDVSSVPLSLSAQVALSEALNCDVIFSCVDRPWGRHLLNQISYAHLVPVIDGGIAVRTNKLGRLASADWRSHVAAPGRACLRCLGQYDLGLVQAEREGALENQRYIDGLPTGHPFRSRENVFPFTIACASRLLLQFVSMVIEPLGQNSFGAEHYHFVGDFWEPKRRPLCVEECPFPRLIALGDDHQIL